MALPVQYNYSMLVILIFLQFYFVSAVSKIGRDKISEFVIGNDENTIRRKPFIFPQNMVPDDKNLEEMSAVSSHGRDSFTTDEIVSSYSVAMRSAYLFCVFSPVVFTSGLAYISPYFRTNLWFVLLASALAQGGAAFIKWGQWSSTRPDMFPEELCVVLSKLHANSPVHSYEFTKLQIEKEFHATIDEIFEEFDPTPLASGSIAQVYKGRLNGKMVAIKVRHPHVKEQIELDFHIMKSIALFLETSLGLHWLHLSESLQQFSHTIAAQTSLYTEGIHLQLFNHNFRKWKDVAFPKPIVMSDSILIETFEEGIHVSEYTKLYNSDRKKEAYTKSSSNLSSSPPLNTTIIPKVDPELAHFIISRGADVYLQMLLIDNLMHADLHPGNILIEHINSEGQTIHPLSPTTTTASSSNTAALSSPQSFPISDTFQRGRAKLVLVDAGMVATLLPSEKENFIGLLESLGEGNGIEAANHVLQFSSSTYPNSVKEKFRLDMDELFLTSCQGYGHKVNIGKVLRGVLHLVRENKISIDVNYATLIMNVLCLDSLAISLLPEYNILDGVRPLLQFHRFCKQQLNLFIFRLTVPFARLLKKISDKNYVKSIIMK